MQQYWDVSDAQYIIFFWYWPAVVEKRKVMAWELRINFPYNSETILFTKTVLIPEFCFMVPKRMYPLRQGKMFCTFQAVNFLFCTLYIGCNWPILTTAYSNSMLFLDHYWLYLYPMKYPLWSLSTDYDHDQFRYIINSLGHYWPITTTTNYIPVYKYRPIDQYRSITTF